MLCYVMLCYIVLYYTILYYIILYYTILYYIILYYIILYYTILYTIYIIGSEKLIVLKTPLLQSRFSRPREPLQPEVGRRDWLRGSGGLAEAGHEEAFGVKAMWPHLGREWLT